MLPLLKKWATAFDALSLRERLMVFGAAAAAIVFVFYFMSFNPLLAKRTALAACGLLCSKLSASCSRWAMGCWRRLSKPPLKPGTPLCCM